VKKADGEEGMSEVQLVRILDAAANVIAERAGELDLLDAAIGDGDHGTNLARGLAAAMARKGELAAAGLPQALRSLAGLIASETGGDGGRIYAAFLKGMAGAAPEGAVDVAALAAMVRAGVEAAQTAGEVRVGEKTLLDVLGPVAQALSAGAAEGRMEGLGSRVMAAAAHGLHRTSRIAARHGLAAGLGEASVNHLDPGAWSSALLVGAVVGVLEPTPAP
jgi:phosphoenolpyruvate---glycerone phosphotransferase subunit DhaL